MAPSPRRFTTRLPSLKVPDLLIVDMIGSPVGFGDRKLEHRAAATPCSGTALARVGVLELSVMAGVRERHESLVEGPYRGPERGARAAHGGYFERVQG